MDPSWGAKGIIFNDFVQKGATITDASYTILNPRFRDATREKRRRKLRKGFFLHQENASSHISTITIAAIGSN